MAKFYRYRLPPWLRKCIFVLEKCSLPIMIYQNIRTFFIPTTLDVLLTAIVTGLFCCFYFDVI
ncbi:hypothetical protein [Salirhabdus sp. Marseille-P4669]|uniref:hypothetical protein n=1 Tax=Salirhabdus sp. Marseille-P4669 TaxID=2042310 RepID=UPI000C7C0E54|nr:hypothetical protein [Salirhabdus sp. Marseille-P4669]